MTGADRTSTRVARPARPGRRAAGATRGGRRGHGPCYVYGVVRSAARVPAGVRGIGDQPGRVTCIRYGHVAAVTSGIPADRPLGTAADLRAHADVLGAFARSGAVLPMQFGGVLADEGAVVTELLEPHHATFADLLDRLRGHEQFTMKGRYLGDAALREVLAEEPEVMLLRERLRGRDVDVHRGEGIQLGELVARALERKRAADTQVLAGALAPHAAAVAEHPTTSPGTDIDAAFLVARPRRGGFEEAAEELGRRWQGRIRLRLLGPLPPYDFAQPLEREE